MWRYRSWREVPNQLQENTIRVDRVHDTFDLGAPSTPSLRLGTSTNGGMSYKALVEMMIG